MLSTSETTIYSQDLRKYTSIFSDIDSEYNEVKIFHRNKEDIENISITTKEMIAKRLVEKISNELKANG